MNQPYGMKQINEQPNLKKWECHQTSSNGSESKTAELTFLRHALHSTLSLKRKLIEWENRVFLDFTKDVQGYEATGFIIWIPDQKCLGSFDVDHKELFIFKDVKWNKFIKRLPIVCDIVLDGYTIDELYK